MASRIPQQNYKDGETTVDHCQTPPEAALLLVPFLRQAGIQTIWEPAAGDDQYIVKALRSAGFTVHATDLVTGQDFLTDRPDFAWDCIVTNPPFSLDYKFMARANQLGRPWAMLMKSDRPGVDRCRDGLFTRSILIQGVEYRVSDYEKIIPSSRISFKMPINGWGKPGKESGAQFHTAWYCRGLNIGAAEIEVPYQQKKRKPGGVTVPRMQARPQPVQVGLWA